MNTPQSKLDTYFCTQIAERLSIPVYLVLSTSTELTLVDQYDNKRKVPLEMCAFSYNPLDFELTPELVAQQLRSYNPEIADHNLLILSVPSLIVIEHKPTRHSFGILQASIKTA